MPSQDIRVSATTPASPERIQWHSSFDPKVPGTGWLYRHQLRRFIKRLVDGLARRAQEHTSP